MGDGEGNTPGNNPPQQFVNVGGVILMNVNNQVSIDKGCKIAI